MMMIDSTSGACESISFVMLFGYRDEYEYRWFKHRESFENIS